MQLTLREYTERATALLRAIGTYQLPFVRGVHPQISVHESPNNVIIYSPNPLLSQDLEGTLNFCNPAASRLFGYSTDELIGTSSGILVPDRLKETRNHSLEQVLARRQPLALRTERLTKSGREISVVAIVFPYELTPHVYSIAALINRA